MYHSMTIIPEGTDIYTNGVLNGINTWDDWHLMPASRPLINPPGIKTAYIDIPGADGVFDLTEAFTDRVLYSSRSGSFEFYVMNGYESWATRYSEIMNYLHGKQFKLILEDDPSFYYQGRMSLNRWQSVKDWSRITLDYNFDPFKYRTTNALTDWLWDPFNFETDMTTDGYKVAVSVPNRSYYKTLPAEYPTPMNVGIKINYRNPTESRVIFRLLDKNNNTVDSITHVLSTELDNYYLTFHDFILDKDNNRMAVNIVPDSDASGDPTSIVVSYIYNEKRL